MFSSLISLILAITSSASLTAPTWQTDYLQARELAVQNGKPLAVVIGSGTAGWGKIVPMNDTTAASMRSGFVCVYIDKTTVSGQKLADAFEMTESVGLVISDRTGEKQAFRHSGTMSEDDVTKAVARYSSTTHVVRKTETIEADKQPAESYTQPTYSPTYWQQPTGSS
jgi:hypothetical protein